VDGHNKVAGGEGLHCYGADFDDEIRSERAREVSFRQIVKNLLWYRPFSWVIRST
jgi:hypothetical protein